MLRFRNRLIVILTNKKFSVRIFILPCPEMMYVLSLLVCPGYTQISFTRFGAEKDLSDVAFATGKNKSRSKTFQTLKNTIVSLSKILWHRE